MDTAKNVSLLIYNVSGTKLGYLSIQIQPEFSPSINSEGYTPEITEGDDSGKYININIKTNNIKELWVKIKEYLQEHNDFANSTIVTCEGSQGWDNYLLLHHFGSKEKLNEIQN